MSTDAEALETPVSKSRHKSKEASERKSSKKHRKSKDSSAEKSAKKHRKSEHSNEDGSSKKRKRLEPPVPPHTSEASPDNNSKRPRLDINGKEPAVPRDGEQATIINGAEISAVDSPSPAQAVSDTAQEFQRDNGKPELPVDWIGRNEPSTDPAGSPFFMQTTSFYLPLSPIAQSSALNGLCAEHLSPLILTYSRPLEGVILSYSNPRFSTKPSSQYGENKAVLSRAIDEYGVTYVWVTADFVLLRPQKNAWIKGYVSVQSESQVGLVCWNLFNASIERERLPETWTWITNAHKKSHTKRNADDNEPDRSYGDGGGYWVDGNGKMVEGPIEFRVKAFESLPAFGKDKTFMSIEGTLLSEEEEAATGSANQSGARGNSSTMLKIEQ